MMNFKKSLKTKMVNERRGQGVLEYTLVLAIIVAVAFTIFSFEKIRNIFQEPVNQGLISIGGVTFENNITGADTDQ